MHPFDQIRVGSFQHHMKVITHQTIGMHLPIGFLARLGERFEKILPIHIIVVYVLAPIPSTHYVMDRSRIINSQLTGHASISPLSPQFVKPQNEPGYGLTPSAEQILERPTP
jgi:hypothetical protein